MSEEAGSRRACIVDAFTTEPFAGNPAGVVPDAAGLAADQMLAIARELGASETAFLTGTESAADRRIRYFTPQEEVDLCGHATVASCALLHGEGAIDVGVHALETDAGTIDVEVTADGTVWMTQATPTVDSIEPDYERLGSALGIDPAALRDVGADLLPAVASTGLPALVVPVNFLEHLGGATPDPDAIEAIAEEYDAAGVYAFTFDTIDAESTLHGRFFAPGLGILEDPVTGTASGACGAYLRRVGAFDDPPEEMRFEQGHFVDRPGTVRVRVGESISVGGRAVPSLDGTIAVPDAEDDDIIEA